MRILCTAFLALGLSGCAHDFVADYQIAGADPAALADCRAFAVRQEHLSRLTLTSAIVGSAQGPEAQRALTDYCMAHRVAK